MQYRGNLPQELTFMYLQSSGYLAPRPQCNRSPGFRLHLPPGLLVRMCAQIKEHHLPIVHTQISSQSLRFLLFRKRITSMRRNMWSQQLRAQSLLLYIALPLRLQMPGALIRLPALLRLR